MTVILAIWRREVLKFLRQRRRIYSSVISPIVFVFMFSFINSEIESPEVNVSSIQFIIPGIIGLTAALNSIFESVSLIEDTKSGFMKEFLVSPVKRSELAIGRMLGDSTKSIFDSTILVIMSIIVGCRYSILTLIILFVSIILVSLTGAAVGILLASKAKSVRGYSSSMQILIIPLLLLSGGYLPINILPIFLKYVTYINPVTYITAFFRYITLRGMGVTEELLVENEVVIKIGNFKIEPYLSFIIICLFGILFFALATKSFKNINKADKPKKLKLAKSN